MRIDYSKIHPHIKARMRQRGISKEELEVTLEKGWDSLDAKQGTQGKTYVFDYSGTWAGKAYEEKEVTVYYKMVDGNLILLTAKARYGRDFDRKGGHK